DMLRKQILAMLAMSGLLLFSCNPQPSETESNMTDEVDEMIQDDMADEVVNRVDDMSEKLEAEGAENYYTDPEGNVVYTYLVEENMPSFTDGSLQEYLSTNLIYPQESRENGSEGTVVVRFIVAKNGEIHNPKVVKPVDDELLNAEALRVVRAMPNWAPGIKDGKAVPYQYSLPISFRLE
ncbi:MAG: energy transducer TonB, partial [Cyclobacteriaceae bacterium]